MTASPNVAEARKALDEALSVCRLHELLSMGAEYGVLEKFVRAVVSETIEAKGGDRAPLATAVGRIADALPIDPEDERIVDRLVARRTLDAGSGGSADDASREVALKGSAPADRSRRSNSAQPSEPVHPPPSVPAVLPAALPVGTVNYQGKDIGGFVLTKSPMTGRDAYGVDAKCSGPRGWHLPNEVNWCSAGLCPYAERQKPPSPPSPSVAGPAVPSSFHPGATCLQCGSIQTGHSATGPLCHACGFDPTTLAEKGGPARALFDAVRASRAETIESLLAVLASIAIESSLKHPQTYLTREQQLELCSNMARTELERARRALAALEAEGKEGK